MSDNSRSAEQQRLDENAVKKVPLETWGPYLSERQWSTIREDYSANGDAWHYFPHDHARSRSYRWGEDGLGGISDYFQNLCFAISLWNGKDSILKERLFGLTNSEGNHGEDVKELYYYVDNIPTHYYMKYLYKYPQREFPYQQLANENAKRSRWDSEYEILDTGIFNDNEYFDVFIEYAKQNSEDIFIKIEIVNRNKNAAALTLLPVLWFYNRWQYDGLTKRPSITLLNSTSVQVEHERLEKYYLYFQEANYLLFTENETNMEKLFSKPNQSPFVKDAFHDAVIHSNYSTLENKKEGTKFSPVYQLNIEGNSSQIIYLRLTNQMTDTPFEKDFPTIFEKRKKEADEFYNEILPPDTPLHIAAIRRQAFAGLLWNKQYYHYDVERWLNESDGISPVSEERKHGRNSQWKYLKNQDVISMPDKWEYPWYAAWDLGFHCISMAMIDPSFAKNQLILMMREWYMNPEGQMPAYEWNFSDVNPPVHAWAALKVYAIEKEKVGKGDIQFLKKIFQKLIINFTWWVNRKDINGNNIFEGGFLGLDNIGIFNRDIHLPSEQTLEQADATSWMGMYAISMMDIALEIALEDQSFEDSATKFYEHFVFIAEALNEMGLWNEEDHFFYDVLNLDGHEPFQLKVRSLVGLTSLFAVSIIKKEHLEKLTDFTKRISWFRDYRTIHHKYLPSQHVNNNDSMLLSLVQKEKLGHLLQYILDESEFLSPGGIRAVSKYHQQHPYSLNVSGTTYDIQYEPAESTSDIFGGNSNWRGPVWMPMNYLIISAINRYYNFYGDSFKVECPAHSGKWMNLLEVANELRSRLISIFTADDKGNRPVFAEYNQFYNRPENKDLILFHEYFHGDNSKGLGSSHQTGWTALIAKLVDEI